MADSSIIYMTSTPQFLDSDTSSRFNKLETQALESVLWGSPETSTSQNEMEWAEKLLDEQFLNQSTEKLRVWMHEQASFNLETLKPIGRWWMLKAPWFKSSLDDKSLFEIAWSKFSRDPNFLSWWSTHQSVLVQNPQNKAAVKTWPMKKIQHELNECWSRGLPSDEGLIEFYLGSVYGDQLADEARLVHLKSKLDLSSEWLTEVSMESVNEGRWLDRWFRFEDICKVDWARDSERLLRLKLLEVLSKTLDVMPSIGRRWLKLTVEQYGARFLLSDEGHYSAEHQAAWQAKDYKVIERLIQGNVERRLNEILPLLSTEEQKQILNFLWSSDSQINIRQVSSRFKKKWMDKMSLDIQGEWVCEDLKNWFDSTLGTREANWNQRDDVAMERLEYLLNHPELQTHMAKGAFVPISPIGNPPTSRIGLIIDSLIHAWNMIYDPQRMSKSDSWMPKSDSYGARIEEMLKILDENLHPMLLQHDGSRYIMDWVQEGVHHEKDKFLSLLNQRGLTRTFGIKDKIAQSIKLKDKKEKLVPILEHEPSLSVQLYNKIKKQWIAQEDQEKVLALLDAVRELEKDSRNYLSQDPEWNYTPFVLRLKDKISQLKIKDLLEGSLVQTVVELHQEMSDHYNTYKASKAPQVQLKLIISPTSSIKDKNSLLSNNKKEDLELGRSLLRMFKRSK